MMASWLLFEILEAKKAFDKLPEWKKYILRGYK